MWDENEDVEDFAFAHDLTLPVARSFLRLQQRALRAAGPGDLDGARAYIVEEIRRELDAGAPWAAQFVTARFRHTLGPDFTELTGTQQAARLAALGLTQERAERWMADATRQRMRHPAADAAATPPRPDTAGNVEEPT